jgi:hypothetical protein
MWNGSGLPSAMFSFNDPSLLQFERRRTADEHNYLYRCLDEAVANGQTVEHVVLDPKGEGVGRFFLFANGLAPNLTVKSSDSLRMLVRSHIPHTFGCI